MEVGIGGRYDATNVVQHPVVCGISSIGLEHTAMLGHTHGEIAYHKGGIIKVPGCGFACSLLSRSHSCTQASPACLTSQSVLICIFGGFSKNSFSFSSHHFCGYWGDYYIF